MSREQTRQIIEHMLAAIESRDLRRVASAFSVDATWQNVPHPEAIGRDLVLQMLAGILTWSDEVSWDLVSSSYGDGIAWVERVDRFRIDGDEHSVPCNGVIRVDVDQGVVTAVRDYVDLGEWRRRIVPVYERLTTRDAEHVVARHLAAVDRREPVAMAADYALDAQLVRGDDRHRGWREIADYFHEVPARLGDSTLALGAVVPSDPSGADVSWRITGADGHMVASGTDHYRVEAGRIVHQTVVIDGDDF